MQLVYSRWNRDPESGLMLVEVTVSLAFFVVLILSVCMTLVAGIRQRHEAFESYQALSALRGMVADMQETANEPQNLPTNDGIGAEYVKYDQQSFSVPRMIPTTVSVAVYPDEAGVPGTLGGPQDLNYDGDAADDLGNASAGTDLKLVPAILTVTYMEGNQTRTITVPRLLAKTAD